MELKSYAKINLFLDVKRKRADGYHEIETIFQSINLYDNIFLTAASKDIILSSNCKLLPLDEKNLAYKAAKLIKDYAGVKKGVKIHIEKKIPIGGGLGGGSSNAASVLIGLNNMWKLNLSHKELFDLAEKIGSDVPFFLLGGRCLAKGRGEKLFIIPNKPKFWVLLLCPDFSIYTKEIYEKLNFKLTKYKNNNKINQINKIDYIVKDFSNIFDIGKHLYNRLEEAVFTLYPQMEAIKGGLSKEGVLGSLVSGSGSSLFAIVKGRKEGEILKEKLSKKYNASLYVVKTL